MSLLEQLRQRSSAKDFIPEPLPVKDLEEILEATSYSPRAANLQHFSVRLLNSRSDLDHLAGVLLDCPYLSSAPAALVFFVDLHNTKEWFESEGAAYPFLNVVGYHYGAFDAALALHAASLVAEEKGYATRILSTALLRAPAVAQVFDCPEYVIPSLVLVLGKQGWPAAGPRRSNLNWSAYTSIGLKSAWKTWRDMYVDSGKADEDVEYIAASQEAYAHVSESDKKSVPRALTTLKYKAEEISLYAINLKKMLARFI